MHLFLVRHGECLAQCDPAEGNNPDTALSYLGERQAQQAAVRLGAEAITNVLGSPLVRSLATASQIAEAAGIGAVEVWPELREGWQGTYQSHSQAELLLRFPLAVLPISMSEAGWSHASDDTYQALFARAAGVASRLRSSFGPADRIAIVSHGALSNYLLHALLDISPATPHWFEMANGSISHLRLVPDPQAERPNWPLYPPVTCEVLSLNDRAHLV